MTDARIFALLLLAIYLSDCVFWASQSSVGFRRLWSATCRLVHPTALLGNDRGGLIAVQPLPPFGDCFVARPWPVSATAEFICSYVAHSLHPDNRPAQEAVLLSLDDIRRVEFSGRTVLVDGKLFFAADSHVLAQAVAKFVSALHKLPRDRRENFIREQLQAGLDVQAVTSRVEAHRQATRWLRVVAVGLFLALVVAVPALLWMHWASLHWVTLSLGGLGLQWTILVLFYRAHQHLFPDAREDRWQHLLFMLFAPPAAIRAHDALGRRLLATFHPLAVAQALCEETAVRQLAARTWRDLQQPRRPVHPSQDAHLAATETATRRVLSDLVRAFCRQHKIDSEVLTTAPAQDPACRSYCPRCHQQYTVSSGACSQCGGIELKTLGG